jgi:hypothetical protein
VDVNPDLTEGLPGGDDFPQYGFMSGTSTTRPTLFSTATADVGLPGNMTGDITFSDLRIQLRDLPGPLSGFGVIAVPLDITGSSIQLLGFNATLSAFDIELNAPFTSSLTPTGNPDEWLWAGLADVTLSGMLWPEVFVPTQGPISLGPYPFSQAVTMPLAGTFAGIPTGTEVNVAIPTGTLQDQDLSLPPIDVPLNLLELGVITAYFHLDTLLLADISTSVVYRNSTPIPEPSTAPLLVLGLVGLAVRRYRQQS